MLKNRLEGLVSLQGIWAAISVTVLFFAYVAFVDVMGLIEILPTFNHSLYAVSVLLGMFLAARLYSDYAERLSRLNWRDAASLTLQQMARLALVLFAVAFVMKDAEVSRKLLGSFIGVAAIAVFFANLFLPAIIARIVFGSSAVPTIVIGDASGSENFSKWLSHQRTLGVEVVGQFDEKTIDQLEKHLEANVVGQVILPMFYLSSEQTRQVMIVAKRHGARVRFVEDLSEGLERPFAIEHHDGLMFLADWQEPLANPVNRFLKRAFDVAFALPVVLFVLPPLFLIVWIMQRRQSPGPIMYRQQRYGEDRRKFGIFKFRTMHVATQSSEIEKIQAKKGDSRIYPFGRILRKTSLDEIPQFLNVLFGDMSVAGPRPHLTHHDDEFAKFVEEYRARHYVKPGITGLAQCNGYRGEITETSLLEKRVDHDLTYIRNWSLWLDFAIVLRTVREVAFPPKSAY